jgi:hypothetical protein
MQLPENSRVWIYQSNRALNTAENEKILQQLNTFTQAWTAHNQQLKAAALVKYNRFIILIVDESQAGATGCSIDKSVHMMKQLEQQYQINLFDRFNLAYRNAAGITSVPRNEFEELIKTGEITEDTIVFNNMVQNVAELQTKWEVPLKNSWHIKLFGTLLAG